MNNSDNDLNWDIHYLIIYNKSWIYHWIASQLFRIDHFDGTILNSPMVLAALQ